MMPDIFSSFDPYMYNYILPSNTLTLMLSLTLILTLVPSFWISQSRTKSALNQVYSVIFSQLNRTQSVQLKGLSTILSSIFATILLINLFGLLPYMLSMSSHLIFTLTLGLPMWMSMILSSSTKAPRATVAHLLPDGAPVWLNPFLVLIETSSILVRPLTLSFRLAANMSAGHIVLGLVGIYGAAAVLNPSSGTPLLLMVSMGYIMFEIAICMIQAYIFCLLLSLYADDHAH